MRAHRICVHQTLAPGTPSSPGMPTSPYGQHNIHTVAAFSGLFKQCELKVRRFFKKRKKKIDNL